MFDHFGNLRLETSMGECFQLSIIEHLWSILVFVMFTVIKICIWSFFLMLQFALKYGFQLCIKSSVMIGRYWRHLFWWCSAMCSSPHMVYLQTISSSMRFLISKCKITAAKLSEQKQCTWRFARKYCKHWNYDMILGEKCFDEDGIRTHACRAQWISSPSP